MKTTATVVQLSWHQAIVALSRMATFLKKGECSTQEYEMLRVATKLAADSCGLDPGKSPAELLQGVIAGQDYENPTGWEFFSAHMIGLYHECADDSRDPVGIFPDRKSAEEYQQFITQRDTEEGEDPPEPLMIERIDIIGAAWNSCKDPEGNPLHIPD